MKEELVQSKPSILNLYNREKLETNGIIKVISSTESEIYTQLVDGNIMQVLGEELTITKLVPEEMLFVASGKIKGINYLSKVNKKSFLKKVFK